MMNILVVDAAGEYGSLVKGVLMSRHLGVSVSLELSEAKDKLQTGLFDIICLDNDARGIDKFITETKELLPATPLIALAEKTVEPDRFFRVIPKPISLSGLVRAVRESITSLDAQHYQSQHKGLTLPVEISAGKETLTCRLAELGLKGAIVIPNLSEAEAVKHFADFFMKRLDKIVARLIGKKTTDKPAEEPTLLKINTRLAYTEQSPDQRIKCAGLSFAHLNNEDEKILTGLLAGQAA